MPTSTPGTSNSPGFTLIEFSIVLFVLGLLAWLVIPRLSSVAEPDRNTVFREIAAGSDPVMLRRNFPGVALMGGLDKRALAWGKDAIDAELERKIPVSLEGGYIATIDHSLPPDIPYENFCYFWERKKEMLGII